MQLSKDFWLSEFTKSQAADRNGIDNTPGPAEIENLRILCNELLQPLRDRLGQVITINSGYRSPMVNALVGGTAKSAHLTGEAVDTEVPSMSTPQWAQYVADSGFVFDQLILEFYDPSKGPYSGWVHLAYRADNTNRNQILTAVIQNGKTKYLPGLIY